MPLMFHTNSCGSAPVEYATPLVHIGLILLTGLAKSLGFWTPQIDFEAEKIPFEAAIEKAATDTLYLLRPNEKFPL